MMNPLIIHDPEAIALLTRLAEEQGRSVDAVVLDLAKAQQYKTSDVLRMVSETDEPYIDPLLKMAEYMEQRLGTGGQPLEPYDRDKTAKAYAEYLSNRMRSEDGSDERPD